MLVDPYAPNPFFADYDPCDPCGEKREVRLEARAKRKALHQPHPNMIKMHIDRDFDDLLCWQQDLWERFIDTFVGRRWHFEGKWSLTINHLLEHARCWERPAEASTAHVKWLAMWFAKKAHRLRRLPLASECPSFLKICEKVRLDEGELKLPCIERFPLRIHKQSRKDWRFVIGRHITSAVIHQEQFKRKRKGKVRVQQRWVVKLCLVPAAQRKEVVEPRRVGRPRKIPAQQVSVFDSHSREEPSLEKSVRTDTCCAGISAGPVPGPRDVPAAAAGDHQEGSWGGSGDHQEGSWAVPAAPVPAAPGDHQEGSWGGSTSAPPRSFGSRPSWHLRPPQTVPGHGSDRGATDGARPGPGDLGFRRWR